MKYVNIGNNNYDQEQMKLLQTIDGALDNAVKGASTHKLQEQLNDLYKKMDPLGGQGASYVQRPGTKDRKIAADYMRAAIKGDKALARQIEEKETLWPSHVLHTGGNDNIDSGSMNQGGYLIPDLLHAEIMRLIAEGGVARREMRYMPFSGPGNERRLPVETGAPSVSWIDEGEAKPATKPTIGRAVQTLKKLAAITIMSDEILEDSAVDLISYLAQRFAEVIMVEEDNQFFAGTGSPWTGLINTAGIQTGQMGVGLIGQNVTPNHMLALKYAVSTYARRGGKFYMNPEIWAGIRSYRAAAVSSEDQEGNYLVQSPVDGTPNLLWGSPVVEVDAMPGFEDTQGPDEPVALFGNLQKTCVYGDKNSTRIKLLDQATVTDDQGVSINLAERDMSAVRVMRRTGFVATLPAGISCLFTGPVS